jgi:hypothetical protein
MLLQHCTRSASCQAQHGVIWHACSQILHAGTCFTAKHRQGSASPASCAGTKAIGATRTGFLALRFRLTGTGNASSTSIAAAAAGLACVYPASPGQLCPVCPSMTRISARSSGDAAGAQACLRGICGWRRRSCISGLQMCCSQGQVPLLQRRHCRAHTCSSMANPQSHQVHQCKHARRQHIIMYAR